MIKNVIANFVGRIWSFFSIFLFVPFYLKFLGNEAYGMVGFYSVILGLLIFADAGLTATLNREFARTDRNTQYKNNLLVTIEIIYIIICILIILGLWFLASIISTKWLNIEGITTVNAIKYIRMIGVSVALQMMSSMYQGGLMGLQKQVLANSLQISYSFVRSGLILIPLFFFPVLDTFFIWQICATILYLFVLRFLLKKQIGYSEKTKISINILHGVWRYALGMMIMSILSSVLMQTDKLVTSKFLSLTEFGYYTLGSSLAQVPIIAVTPIGLALLPKFTELISNGKKTELNLLFRRGSFIIATISTIISLILIVYMPNILFLWTGNKQLTEVITLVARILCLGSLFQALQLLPYFLGIANGHTSTNIKLGVLSIAFLIPSLIFLVKDYGIVGAGVPWLIMSFITFILLGTIITYKFNVSTAKWIFNDTLVPVIFIFVIVFLISRLIFSEPVDNIFVLYSLVIGLVSLFGSLALYRLLNPHEASLLKFQSNIFKKNVQKIRDITK